MRLERRTVLVSLLLFLGCSATLGVMASTTYFPSYCPAYCPSYRRPMYQPSFLPSGLAKCCLCLDTTPPSIDVRRTPAPNANGWNDTSVNVTLRTTDAQCSSGIAAIYYRLDRQEIKIGTNQLLLSEGDRVA